MTQEISVGDTVVHHLGGPSGVVHTLFKYDGVPYAMIKGQLGAVPLQDLVKLED